MSKYIVLVALVGLVGCAEDGTSCFADTDGACIQVSCTDGSLETICPGDDGTNGVDGADGTNGTNGVDGADGTNGTDGTNGVDGADGTNGTDGVDGVDGVDGTNGVDGVDGADAEVLRWIVSTTVSANLVGPQCQLARPVSNPFVLLTQVFVCNHDSGCFEAFPESNEPQLLDVPENTHTCISVWELQGYEYPFNSTITGTVDYISTPRSVCFPGSEVLTVADNTVTFNETATMTITEGEGAFSLHPLGITTGNLYTPYVSFYGTTGDTSSQAHTAFPVGPQYNEDVRYTACVNCVVAPCSFTATIVGSINP